MLFRSLNDRLDDVEFEMKQECRELAHEMVRVEEWAFTACARRQFYRVAELHTQREAIRQRRSELLRELWWAEHA
jgi:hypothetical protein